MTAFRRNRALRGRIAPVPGGIGNSIAIFSARVVSATEEVRRRGAEGGRIKEDTPAFIEYYRLEVLWNKKRKGTWVRWARGMFRHC